MNCFFFCLNSKAYQEVKKERPPFQAESPTPDVMKPDIPKELQCSLCQDLLSDAVLIPCCGDSYCDDCKNALCVQLDRIGIKIMQNVYPLFFFNFQKVFALCCSNLKNKNAPIATTNQYHPTHSSLIDSYGRLSQNSGVKPVTLKPFHKFKQLRLLYP